MDAKPKAWIPLVAVLAVSAALIGAIAVTLPTARYQGLVWNNHGMTPDLALLNEPRTATDEPPAYLVEHLDPADPSRYVADSFRHLGEYEGVSLWAARTADGNVCFVASTADKGAGGSCGSIRLFNQSGSGLGYSGISDRPMLIAALVPDRALPHEATGLERPFPGVVVVPEGTKRGTALEVPVMRGTPIPVHVFQ